MTTYQNFALRKITKLQFFTTSKNLKFVLPKSRASVLQLGTWYEQFQIQQWDKSLSNTNCSLDSHLSSGWRNQPFEQSKSSMWNGMCQDKHNILICAFLSPIKTKPRKLFILSSSILF